MSTLADSIATMLNFGMLFGLFPRYNSKTKSFIKIPLYTYTIIAGTFISTTSTHLQKFLTSHHANAAEVILYNIPPLLTDLANLTAMFQINFFKPHLFQAVFDKFNIIDAQLAGKLCLNIPQLKLTNLRLALIPLPVIIVSVYELVERIQENRFPPNYYYYVHARLQLYFTFFVVLFQRRVLTGVAIRLQVLNGFLKRAKLEQLRGKKVEVAIQVQDAICDLVEDLNEMFGWNVLLTLMQNFVGVLGLINTFLFKYYGWKKAMFNCVWNIYITMQGIMITRNCEHVTRESQMTISVSYKCLQRASKGQHQLHEKFFILTQQATARCPAFTAAGLFPINYNMLFTFVNMITSYVIVLVQFESNIRASKVCQNVTII